MFSTERLKISKSTWIKYLLEINFASSEANNYAVQMYRDMGKARDGVTLSEQVQKHKTSRPFIVVNKNIYILSRVGPRDCFGEAGQINGSKFPSPIPHPTHQQNNLVYTKTVDSIFRAQMLWMKM